MNPISETKTGTTFVHYQLPLKNGNGYALNPEKRRRKKIRVWWKELPNNIKYIGLFLLLIGALVIALAIVFMERGLSNMGHVLLVLGSVVALHAVESLVHHYFLHRKFVEHTLEIFLKQSQLQFEEMTRLILKEIGDLKKSMIDAQDLKVMEANIIKALKEVALNEFSDRVERIADDRNAILKNLHLFGITNVFWGLNANKLFDRVEESRDTTFIILRIFFSENEFNLLVQHLKQSIEQRNCRFKIILLNHTRANLISARLRLVVNDPKAEGKRYSTAIETQCRRLYKIQKSLQPEFQDHLEVRVHHDIPFVAMFGMGDKIIYSDYLHSKLSERGLQIQVRQHSYQFEDLEEHFRRQWNNSQKYSIDRYGGFQFFKPPGENT